MWAFVTMRHTHPSLTFQLKLDLSPIVKITSKKKWNDLSPHNTFYCSKLVRSRKKCKKQRLKVDPLAFATMRHSHPSLTRG